MELSNKCHWIAVACLCLLAMTTSVAAFADQNSQPPATATTNSVKPVVTNLNKVQVKGIRQLVHTLQTVKIALKRHFNNDPKRVDEMICEFNDDDRSAPFLDCGTQGWYRMRQEATQLSLECRCDSTAPTLGHPWHSVRYLNHTQIMHLKNLLKKLPAPDSDRKIPVEWDERHTRDQKELDTYSGR
jgi:hypothetical protein